VWCVQPAERKIEESKLVLEGLVQHYLVVNETDKSRHLVELLDNLDFNQVCLL
jgi:ATP-dependent RNA helicase UAP56/SUB2